MMKNSNRKKSILFIPCNSGTAGGSRVGTITASFGDLKEMFGEPAFEGKGDNITTEFVIDFELYDEDEEDGGELERGSFSLYDWGYSRNFGNDYEDITWNVGGKSYMSSVAAEYALGIFQNTDTRYGHEDAVLCHAEWHELPNRKEVA